MARTVETKRGAGATTTIQRDTATSTAFSPENFPPLPPLHGDVFVANTGATLPARPAPDTPYKRTPTVERVEHEHGDTLPNLLYSRYWERNMSAAATGQSLGISAFTVLAHMASAGIPRRTRTENWSDTERKERTKQSLKDAWERDKESRVNKVNTPKAIANRSASRRKFYEDHPERRSDIHELSQRYRENRLKEALGDDPKAELERLIDAGLTIREAANKLKYKDTATVARLLKKYGVTKKFRSPTAGMSHFPEASRNIIFAAMANGTFDTLPHRQQKVLGERAGISGPSRTLDAIASDLRITREGVRVIQAKGLQALQPH